MARKPVPGLNRKILVEFPSAMDKFDVYDKKDMPDVLKQHPDYGTVDWVGNFGIRDDTGKDRKGRLPMAYDVLVEEVSDKDILCYWDGSNIVQIPQHGRRVPDGGRNYGTAKLDLGDPPVGWA
jgi:hypothetical protein